MTRFCSSCGKELRPTSLRFCEYCGAPVIPDGLPINEVNNQKPSATMQATEPISSKTQKDLSPPSKKRLPSFLITGGIIIIILILLVILIMSGIVDIASISSDFTSKPSAEVNVADTPVPVPKENAYYYTSLAPLPKEIVILGQIQGPIPGRGVEFIFEGGPGTSLFKSWTAVLIAPDGSLVDTKAGQTIRNELITLKAGSAGTYTGLIVATSYSGETYKVREKSIVIRV
jgi:hypothetical protein